MFVHNWQMIKKSDYTLFIYRKPAIYWMAGKEGNMQDTLFN